MPRTGPHGVLARLGALDPARDLPDQGATAQDEALHHILNSPRRPQAGDFVPQRRTGPMVAASVLVVLALAVGALVWTFSTPPVYATWSAQPEPFSAGNAREAREQCPMVAHEIVGDPDDPEVRQVGLEPVLIDVRGEYTYVISADDQGRFAECFVTRGEERSAVSSDAGFSADAWDSVTIAPAQGVQVLHAGTATWSREGEELPGALTSVFGRSAHDVEEVILVTESGDRVHASVQDGWWAAWAPGDESIVGEVTVVTTDGRTHQQELLEGDSAPVEEPR
ncbi:hypothetical protein ACO0LV_14535 [Pseudactinotalea sp. Z1739]|uniref:hypothetical protein n=1 Tax=Pseudactinotalea sp. Z1739 TaxID=3413028 RepID=UPI003C7D53F0